MTDDRTTVTAPPRGIQRFGFPRDPDALDAAMAEDGVAILRQAVPDGVRRRFMSEVDDWLTNHPDHPVGPVERAVEPDFLGHRTLRLLGLAGKAPTVLEAITLPDLTGWARRMLAPLCCGIALSSAEVTEVHPGQTMQMPHRDSDMWVHFPRGDDPIMVLAITAVSRFTAENGATLVVPGSHRWEDGRWPRAEDFVPAEMDPGDALLTRADLIHCAGANVTADDRRRSLTMIYQPGWLRPYENHYLSVGTPDLASWPAEARELLGFDAYESASAGGGTIGLVDGARPLFGDPVAARAEP